MAKEPRQMSYAELAQEMWKREDSSSTRKPRWRGGPQCKHALTATALALVIIAAIASIASAFSAYLAFVSVAAIGRMSSLRTVSNAGRLTLRPPQQLRQLGDIDGGASRRPEHKAGKRS